MKYVITFLLSFIVLVSLVNAQISTKIQVDAGWNLLSVPLQVNDVRKIYLFPTSSSQSYIYKDAYLAKDTIYDGVGFWLKYNVPGKVTIIGNTILKDSIPVQKGWNILGSITFPVGVNNIESNPPGLISSQFFSYASGIGYRAIDSIQPGKGCWIKVNQNGLIILSSPPLIPTLSYPPNNSKSISITPAITWLPSNYATSYSLQISRDSLFSSYIYNQEGLTDTNQQINGLDYSTKYFWRIKSTNSHGTFGWSNTWSFSTYTPCPGTPIVLYEGKTYNTIQIGNQCWLKENLNVGTFVYGFQNQVKNNIIQKLCYNNDSLYCETYGGLYRWNVAMQYSEYEGTRGICPVGWHIPTYEELSLLKTTVANSANALKEIGQGTGTNSSGFSALLAGNMNYYGTFNSIGIYTAYWCSSEPFHSEAIIMYIFDTHNDIWINPTRSNSGVSVRCLKDGYPEPPQLQTPSNGTTDLIVPPTLTWIPSIGATSYAIQVSTDSLFLDNVYYQIVSTNPSYEFNGLVNGLTYYWRMNSTNGTDTSAWSNTWSFSIKLLPPTLSLPLNEIINLPNPPTLVWSVCTGRSYYTLQVSTDSLFSKNVYTLNQLTETTRTVYGLNNGYKYYWRVNARNSKDTSTWSDRYSFVTLLPAPSLSSPVNGAINISTSPTLFWESNGGATSFTLQVSSDSLFLICLYNQNGLTELNQQVSGMTENSKYYWRVKSLNSYEESAWSDTWMFTTTSPCLGTPTVLYEGKTYNTIQVGEQCWLKENLDVGRMITGTTDQTNNSMVEKYCYNNDTLNCETYGGLYQWNEAMQYSTFEGIQGICPTGWHLPTSAQFQLLKTFVNEDGNSLKENGQGQGDGSGTNSSGFSSLLSGSQYKIGFYLYLGGQTNILSSTTDNNTNPAYLNLNNNNNIISIDYNSLIPTTTAIGLFTGPNKVSSLVGVYDTNWNIINYPDNTTFTSIQYFNKDTVFASSDHNIYRSNNGGRTWFDLHIDTLTQTRITNLTMLSNYIFPTAKIIFACGDSGLILRSSDRGKTWKKILLTNRYENFKNIHVVSDQGSEYVCGDSIIMRSSNFGSSWTVQNIPIREQFTSIKFITNAKGRVVGTNGTILYTSSSGTLWLRETTNTTANLNAISYVGNNNWEKAWAVGDNGTILKANSAGPSSWTQLQSGTIANLNSVNFIDSLKGFVFGDGGLILYTNTGGQSWTQIPSNTTTNLFQSTFLPPLQLSRSGFSVRCLKDN